MAASSAVTTEVPTWQLDPTHSSVEFSVKHMMMTTVRGRFKDVQATLTGDRDHTERAGVQATIAVASIDTGVADRDTHLRSGDFFDAQAFPTLRFASTKVVHEGGDRYRVHGELTIRDVTRPIVLKAELGGTGKDPWGNDRVAFTAKTSIDRYDYGLKWNQALETGGLLVGRTIDIELEVQAVRAAATAAA